MSEPVVDQILRAVDQAARNYHRLILVVGLSGTGKTAALQELHALRDMPYINLNLQLAEQMLDLTERQRAVAVPRLLNEIIEQAGSDILILDNIEILFQDSLHQDPLRILQNLSRNRTLVVAWNGCLERDHLLYAVPEHREFKRYPSHELLMVPIGG